MNRGPSIDAVLAPPEAAPPARGSIVRVPRVRQLPAATCARILRELHGVGAGGARRERDAFGSDRSPGAAALPSSPRRACFAERRRARTTDLCVVAVGGYARREMSHPLGRRSALPATATAHPATWRASPSAYSTGCGTRRSRSAARRARSRTRSTSRATRLDRRDRHARRRASWRAAACSSTSSSEALRQRAASPTGALHREPARGNAPSAHMQYGESLYLLQPNLKEGAGGLRDYHAASGRCAARSRARAASTICCTLGLLTEDEMAELRGRARLPLARAQRAAPALGTQARPDELRAPGADRGSRSASRRTMAPTTSCRSSASWASTTAMRARSDLLGDRDRAVHGARCGAQAAAAQGAEVEDGLPRRRAASLEIPHAAHAARAAAAPAARLRDRAEARRHALAQGAAPGAREPRPDRRRLPARSRGRAGLPATSSTRSGA